MRGDVQLRSLTLVAVTLRSARPEDADEIAEIWRLGWRDGHLGHVPQELVEARTDESFRVRAAERIPATTVAVGDGAVAGVVVVVGDEVEPVYVSAAHPGEGVAGALLDEAERRVAAAGHARAWLAVVAGNARAGLLREVRLARRGAVRLRRRVGGRADRGAVPPLREGRPG